MRIIIDSFNLNENRETRSSVQTVGSSSEQMRMPIDTIDATAATDFFTTDNDDHCLDPALSFIDNFAFDDASTLIGGSLHPDHGLHATTSSTSPGTEDTSQGATTCCHSSTAPPDNVENLLDLQSRLAKLSRAFSDGASTSENVEDLYRTNADIISVLDGLDATQLHDECRIGCGTGANDSSLPKSIALLLLPTCYYSLLHNFELLGHLLYRELSLDLASPSPATSVSSAGDGNDLDPDACQHHQAHRSGPERIQLPVLSISVGAVRVTVPHREAVEMNLQLLSRMIQQLRESMGRCLTRSGADPKSAGGLRGGAGTLFRKAMTELGRREDVLVDTLRRRGFSKS